MPLPILAIIAFAFLFFSIIKPYSFFNIIILFVFVKGILVLIEVPDSLIHYTIQYFIIIFFISVILNATSNNRKILMPGLKVFTSYTLIVFLSIILNNSPWINSFSFYRHTLDAYLIFLAVLNLPLSELRIFKINKLIFYLFLVQIAASVVKFMTVGVQEQIIGTVAATAGTYSTIIPLIAISFLFILYLFYQKRSIYLWLTLGFLFMGWVGNKRAIYIFLPIVLFIIFLIYLKENKQKVFAFTKNIKVIIIILIFSLLVIYFGVKYTSTLNPQNIVGGSFDVDFISEYLFDYNFGSPSGGGEYGGRGGGTIVVYNALINAGNIITPLFGFGPDILIDVSRYEGSKLFNFRFEKLIGTGLFYFLLSVGFLGSLALMLFYFWFGKHAYKILQYRLNSYYKAVVIGVIIITTIFFIDFIFYSRTFAHSTVINLVYFYLLGIILKPDFIQQFSKKL